MKPDKDAPQTGQAAPPAWPIPLTFLGMALFSQRPASWLLSAWIALACLTAGTLLWFLHLRWIPILEASIQAFPEKLVIREGQLEHLPPDFTRYRQNRFFSLALRENPEPDSDMTADFQILLTCEEIRLQSLFGYLSFPYPGGQWIPLAPNQIMPWWRARKVLFTAIAFAFLVIGLLAVWTGLATSYCLPIAAVSFLASRRAEFGTAWRLAGNVLIPGAAILIASIILYGLHWLSFFGLLLAAGLHLLIGWIYALGAICRLPGRTIQPTRNPFAPPNPPSRNAPSNASN